MENRHKTKGSQRKTKGSQCRNQCSLHKIKSGSPRTKQALEYGKLMP
jgi:hypothetical protein